MTRHGLTNIKFTGIHLHNLKEFLLRRNICTLTSFVALLMQLEGNAPKNGERTAGFSFTTILQHTGQFGQGFLSKTQCDNTGALSMLS